MASKFQTKISSKIIDTKSKSLSASLSVGLILLLCNSGKFPVITMFIVCQCLLVLQVLVLGWICRRYVNYVRKAKSKLRKLAIQVHQEKQQNSRLANDQKRVMKSLIRVQQSLEVEIREEKAKQNTYMETIQNLEENQRELENEINKEKAKRRKAESVLIGAESIQNIQFESMARERAKLENKIKEIRKDYDNILKECIKEKDEILHLTKLDLEDTVKELKREKIRQEERTIRQDLDLAERETLQIKHDELQKAMEMERKKNESEKKRLREDIQKLIVMHEDDMRQMNDNISVLSRKNEQLMEVCYDFMQLSQKEDKNQKSSFLLKDILIKFSENQDVSQQFEFIKEIGRGGKGKADLGNFQGKQCVMKTMYDGQVDIQELQIMSHLNGAGGAPILLASTESYFVCSCVGHLTLSEVIGGFDVPQSDMIEIICDVAGRVKEIQEKGISHNDLKGNNIMLYSGTMTTSIIDFGLSCQIGGSFEFNFDDVEMERLYWMAPEFKKGEKTTANSDVYSLGALLGRMLSFYETKNEVALVAVGISLSDNPEDRPSIDEFIALLCNDGDIDGMDLFSEKALSFINGLK